MSNERTALAGQQTELVAALTRSGATPVGFNSAHIDRTADALLSKRRRTVEKSWPVLASALGDSFRETFRRFAAAHRLAANDSIDDGRHFAEFLLMEKILPIDAAPILLAIRLRSGPPLQMLRLNTRCWIGLRLPILGTRVRSIWSPFSSRRPTTERLAKHSGQVPSGKNTGPDACCVDCKEDISLSNGSRDA